MKAVDSEFRRNLSNEARRKYQIEKTEIACKSGPLNRFSTGNFTTLNVPNIREKLLEYYDAHYSSNLMTLCVVGNESLDSLQSMVVEHFSEITNRELPLRDFTQM